MPATPTIPRELVGWFESARCVRALVPSPARVFVRIAERRVDLIFSDSHLETGIVRLEPSKQDEWAAVSGTYEIGKAKWMDDGWVIVTGPYVAPSTERSFAGAELKTLSRRITLAEAADGWLLTLSAANRTGDHSRLESLQCLVVPVRDEQVARLNEQVALLSGPRTCEVARSCCRAIRARKNDEESKDVCDGALGVSPQLCRTWLDRAIDEYRFSQWECTPEPDGGSSCAIPSRSQKPRPAPPECTAPEIGLGHGAIL